MKVRDIVTIAMSWPTVSAVVIIIMSWSIISHFDSGRLLSCCSSFHTSVHPYIHTTLSASPSIRHTFLVCEMNQKLLHWFYFFFFMEKYKYWVGNAPLVIVMIMSVVTDYQLAWPCSLWLCCSKRHHTTNVVAFQHSDALLSAHRYTYMWHCFWNIVYLSTMASPIGH